jgi:hypothetical protein
MSRVTLVGVSSVLVLLALSPVARSAPTTQPYSDQENLRLNEALARVLITPAPTMQYARPLPSPRAILPTQKTPSGWTLRNRNSNTWHYIVPVGSQF